MSRSIHENRAKKGFYSIDWDEIDKKRRTKTLTLRGRASKGLGAVPGPTTNDAVPIELLPMSDLALCPVSANDIATILTGLPIGSSAGISCIELKEWRVKGLYYRLAIDRLLHPYVGLRQSFLNGVLVPKLKGFYSLDTGKIVLHSYLMFSDVRAEPQEERAVRAEILGTLVHEVAHGVDHAFRRNQRWRMDNEDKDEAFAERTAEEWFDSTVLPYVNGK